jgi:hypothetical protein
MLQSGKFTEEILAKAEKEAAQMLNTGEHLRQFLVGHEQGSLWIADNQEFVAGIGGTVQVQGIKFYIGLMAKGNQNG